MSDKQVYSISSSDTIDVLENSIVVNTDTIPLFAKKIIKVYPDFDIKYLDNSLIFSDGTKIIYDDGKDKSFIEKLDNCDIEDMFSMTYDVERSEPLYLNDCGRGRCEVFFKKMYGNNEAAVRKNLVPVDWFGQKLPFTKVNGAADSLGKVASELSQYPKFHKYLKNASSFYWRKIKGTNRQSAHSYGIAIDINTQYSNYWLWSNPKSSEKDKLKYENHIPHEIVRVFEKHGFIWGGRWYHFDTMHFEYRPEILNSESKF
ncbi:MAG: M15 family metallopeptidase [Prevotella sp.]|nr:M15 family metallopeptidase [Prevotella sp.]